MIRQFLTDWLYWPMVVSVIAGSITWTLNCVSVTYTEIYAQIEELKRRKKEHDDKES